MKYLGIDFGEKNIGIAVSDEEGTMAFPLKVIKNSKKTLAEVKKIFVDEKAESVVLGESLNLKGEPNKIMTDVQIFKENLEKEIGKQMLPPPLLSCKAIWIRKRIRFRIYDSRMGEIILIWGVS